MMLLVDVDAAAALPGLGEVGGCSQFYWHPVQMMLLQMLPGSLCQSDPSFYPSFVPGSKSVHALGAIFLDLGSLLGHNS